MKSLLGFLAGLIPSLVCALPQEPGYVPPSYWSQFPATKGKWDQPGFYPIGVWLQNVIGANDTAADKAAGINTYVGITAPSDPSVARAAGMYVIQQYEVTQPSTPNGIHPNYGAETVGWLVGDEYDMRHGDGWGGWDGIDEWQHCTTPSKSGCGYTVSQTVKNKFPKTGRFYFSNYSKGVVFWEPEAAAAVFLNGGFQSTSGADVYWHDDKDACASTQGGRLSTKGLLVATGPSDGYDPANTLTPGECARSSNVAAVTERLRGLDGVDGKYQPLWCFVNTGRVTPAQMQGEVAACIISGAYPIYFNHVFATGLNSPCTTQQALRDACYSGHRAQAAAIGTFIKANAAALNAPRLRWDFGTPSLLTRLSQTADGAIWVFAMQKVGQSGTHTLTLPVIGSPQIWRNSSEISGVSSPGNKLTLSFSAETDWYAVRIAEAAVPPIEPTDPVIQVHQSWIDAIKALVNNPR